MSLRIGIDLDGTVADLSSFYHEVEERLLGARSAEQESDELGLDEPSDKERLKAVKAESRRRDQVWRALRNTPNMWTLLKPIEPGAVRALYDAARLHDWEIFFITQRPKTLGANVQAQTQQWLIDQGFETPSVLTLSGSRGKAANVLDLDFLIDDLPRNCVDVISDSKCRPILILHSDSPSIEASARRMNIGVVRSLVDAIGILSLPGSEPRVTLVSSILRTLGLSR